MAEQAKSTRKDPGDPLARHGVFGIVRHHWRAILIAIALVAATNSAGYALTSYMPTYLETEVGVSNLMAARIVSTSTSACKVAVDGYELETRGTDLDVTGEAKIVIRPERVGLEEHGSESGPNRIPGMVERVVYVGSAVQVIVRAATGDSLQALVQNTGVGIPYEQGTPLQLHLPADALRVLPHTSPFDSRSETPRPVGLVGVNRSPRLGAGVEFADIRPFRPGDRLRRISWRVSVRSRELHVTTSPAEQDSGVLLVVDALGDHGHSGGLDGEASSLDQSVRAAAAVADHHVRAGARRRVVSSLSTTDRRGRQGTQWGPATSSVVRPSRTERAAHHATGGSRPRRPDRPVPGMTLSTRPSTRCSTRRGRSWPASHPSCSASWATPRATPGRSGCTGGRPSSRRSVR